MEQQAGWEATTTNRIGDRVRRLRAEQRMSAQALADECEQLGYPIPRSTIAKLERGNRSAVPVQEVAILARALDVPPVDLLFDIGAGDAPVNVVPGESMTPAEAVEWWSGTVDDGRVKIALRERADHRRALAYAERFAEAKQRFTDFQLGITEGGDIRDSPAMDADGRQEHAHAALERAVEILAATRAEMTRQGMTPPPIDMAIREIVDRPGSDR